MYYYPSYGYGYGYGFQFSYLLILIGIVICALASWRMRATFNKYNKVTSRLHMTGRDAALQLLNYAGITDVRVEHVSGNLTDHYDPSHKVLRLSDSTYGSISVAAIGVAAHECGHAIQHQVHYVPLSIRSALVPVANFGSSISWILIILGFFFNSSTGDLLLNIGIIAFSLAVLFQIVTLPVEFNASNRALAILGDSGMLYQEEVKDVRRVLRAAAMTYVAGALSSILQLLRLVLMTGNRRN